MAGLSSLRGLIDSGSRAVEIVYHKLDVTGTWLHVVMVKVVVGTHDDPMNTIS